jgi:hypothetical protein
MAVNIPAGYQYLGEWILSTGEIYGEAYSPDSCSPEPMTR